MRVSEAIRLGAMMGPQLRFNLFDQRTLGTCAWGAALLASNRIYFVSSGEWKIADDSMDWAEGNMHAVCPVCGITDNKTSIIFHLNDLSEFYHNVGHGWTRERIADWVERTFEQPQQDPTEEEICQLMMSSSISTT